MVTWTEPELPFPGFKRRAPKRRSIGAMKNKGINPGPTSCPPKISTSPGGKGAVGPGVVRAKPVVNRGGRVK